MSFSKSLFISFVLFTSFVLLIVEAGKSSKQYSKRKSRAASSRQSTCYDDIDEPYVFFSTKTSYRWNRNKDDDEIKIDGCEAKQFWFLGRHGARNPGTKNMIELQAKLPVIRDTVLANHKAGRGSLCKDDLENLEEWRFRGDVTADKFLVPEGFDELEDIGDRYQERFPLLLSRPFNNQSYVFQHTDSQRTEASAQAFAKGMFGKRDAPNIILKKTSEPDGLLKFDRSCNKWIKEVDENPKAIAEKETFEKSEEFNAMIKAVSDRLGFASAISLKEIDMVYTMCAFDKAWRPKKLSPWCAAFSEDDAKILEYREDLEYYYEDGYGFPINYEQACMPLKDVYENFKQVVDGASSRPKGIFYFSHSGTMLKVMARLGLFNDSVPLKHSNRQQMANREWRTSLIDPFASNVAFTLFKCVDGHRVKAFVQERAVKLPGCASELCTFNEFSAKYEPIATRCSLDNICRV